MQSSRLRALAQQIRIQTQQHPSAQRVLADRLDHLAANAPCKTVAARLSETARGLRALAGMTPWEPMTRTEREQLADFLDLAASTTERVEGRTAAGGAA